jgi:ABC-2 type transport system permease protein
VFRGFGAIFYKEVLHMRRDSMAIMLALVVPLIQMTILGAAIDTNVRQVPTAVYDESGILESTSAGAGASEDSRALLERFRNSDTFKIYKFVHSDAALNQEMVAGRARVGIKIPYDFDRNLLKQQSAQIMVMVDGSDSSVAGQALNVAAAIGLDESLRRAMAGRERKGLLVDIRPKMMFNPDSRSPNFFLPGLIVVLMIMITTMLTAFSVVREKERGTLEQLMVTPVRPLGLMLGKIMPYFVLAVFELIILLVVMVYAFAVPMHGNPVLLVALACTYLFTHLALGMLISVRANSQVEAMQAAFSIMLPTIFLSGYIFPRATMPLVFYLISFLIPATYMVNISRGIILRGAGFMDLWPNVAALVVIGVVVLAIAVKRFGKMVA